ncbi:hypothetical protein [Streptomyces sp. NRRL S-495]|uniref:hypothetical protein n=1 Tax=Streptomyces sp. NRRL S-495 TaxID=1609133 RepID=UPI00069653F6|nr:hypothetical protein [Streptomyces sp. NRRL S-495]
MAQQQPPDLRVVEEVPLGARAALQDEDPFEGQQQIPGERQGGGAADEERQQGGDGRDEPRAPAHDRALPLDRQSRFFDYQSLMHG